MARYALGCIKDPYDHRDLSMATFLPAVPLAEDAEDLRARLSQSADKGSAESAVAAGHNRDLAVEAKHHMPESSGSSPQPSSDSSSSA